MRTTRAGRRSRADRRPKGSAAVASATLPPLPMRICLLYDCLFPWTVGGAERWYRNLAERLAAEGHDVTYLTPRCSGTRPSRRGSRASRSSPSPAPTSSTGPTATGAIGPPLRFGRGRAAATCCATAPTTTSCTPRRSRTSRCWPPGSRAAGTASGSWSTGTRSGRATTGASYLGPRRRRRRPRGPARLRAAAPARLLLQPPAPRPPARGGPALDARRSSRASTPATLTPPEPNDAEPGRRLRRAATSPRSARRAVPPAVALARERGAPELRRGGLRRRARARRRSSAPSTTRACAASSARPGSSTTTSSRRALRARAVPRAALSSREGYGMVVVEASAEGHAVDRRARPRQRRGRARRGRRQRRRRRLGLARGPGRGDPARPRRRPGAARVDLRVVRRATRERLSLERSLRTVVEAYARWDRARA